jgi:hypothetical protein
MHTTRKRKVIAEQISRNRTFILEKLERQLQRAYPKIYFRACESHALKHRDDFRYASLGILGYALSLFGISNFL